MEDIILKFSKYDLAILKEKAKEADKTIEDYLQNVCLKSLTIFGTGINYKELQSVIDKDLGVSETYDLLNKIK